MRLLVTILFSVIVMDVASQVQVPGMYLAPKDSCANALRELAKNGGTADQFAKIKKGFTAMMMMARQAKGGDLYCSKNTNDDTIKTAGTAAAATLVAVGHPCLGWSMHGECVWWHFDRAAANDLNMWMDREIHLKLPTEDLCYVKCALLNWRQLMADIKSTTHTAVKHGHKTAYIGRDDDQKTILTLEKLLYKK